MKTTKKQFLEELASEQKENSQPSISVEDLATLASMENQENKRASKNLQIGLNFGESGAKLSKQLKAQGHKFDKGFIKECEVARVDILALHESGILDKKDAKKAFTRLSDFIARSIAYETYGDAIQSIEKVK